MKRVFTFMVAVLLTAIIFAQSPEKMSYQAVIRNSNNQLVTNQTIGMRISILQGSPGGTAVYVEIQEPVSNANGLVSLEIGSGSVVSGNFSSIDWANGTYFIKTETDLNGGINYTITSTSQLLSVPYALHAKTAETITSAVTETDPVFTSWDKSTGISITQSQISDLGDYIETENDPVFTEWDRSTGISITQSQISDLSAFIESETDPVFNASVAKGISAADTTNWNNKLDSYTETQKLSEVLTLGNDANGIQIKNIADPTDSQDAVTKAYVDLLISQIEALGNSNLILWNKLGSIDEVEHSVVGPDGTIVGSVNFNNTVKFSKGITPNTGRAESGIDFPTTVVDPERGCVEMWVRFYCAPVAYSHGVYGFINVHHWTHNVMLFSWHNDGSLLQFSLQFNGTGRNAELSGFNPPLDTPIHIACVWDRTGIDGTSEYMRIYVDGDKVAVNDTNNDWGTNNTSGSFRVAAPWDSNFSTDRYTVDDIKVWNYAKTNF
ncbi:MAG: LamG-like jellyroll fold domain-containing protein [Bacteroidales bacterium]|jgi:hypothetical protein|nr:LamG domain-containing protein [Bacteroidales bacterium]